MNKKAVQELSLMQKIWGKLDFMAVQVDNVPRNHIPQICLLILTYL